jgi:hypothetical protein
MGALLACAVSLQGTGALPLISSAEAATCCCHHDKSRACRCPTCTHARELASNQRFIRTCAGSSEPALILVQVAPALPQPGLLVPAAIPDPFPILALPSGPASPDREVPTPPPLVSRR